MMPAEPHGTLCGVDRDPGVHLLRSADRVTEMEAFLALVGGRVGLGGVLDDLNRTARATRVPAPAAVWGFHWDDEDMRSQRWWPQGITTSADAVTPGTPAPGATGGRDILVTSAYAHVVDGVHRGARLTFVDLTDRSDIRYRHVLLVEPFLRHDGAVDVRPVKVHAGGIVWHGEHVHVAGTARGFSSFRLADIVAVPARESSRLAVRADGVEAFGYRYLLPVRFTYDAGALDGTEPLRYSFASVDRSTTPHELVAGEYGRGDMTTRLVRYPFDPRTSLLSTDTDGAARPVVLDRGGVPGMQGATVVRGTWFVTTSRGRFRLGSVWAGRPGELREHRHQLPVGPEDITYWPSRDQLWSLSEYPGARYVFAMPRERFSP
jgi:hypothetical protein